MFGTKQQQQQKDVWNKKQNDKKMFGTKNKTTTKRCLEQKTKQQQKDVWTLIAWANFISSPLYRIVVQLERTAYHDRTGVAVTLPK